MHSVERHPLLGSEILHEAILIVEMPHFINALLVDEALRVPQGVNLDGHVSLALLPSAQGALVHGAESALAQQDIPEVER